MLGLAKKGIVLSVVCVAVPFAEAQGAKGGESPQPGLPRSATAAKEIPADSTAAGQDWPGEAVGTWGRASSTRAVPFQLGR